MGVGLTVLLLLRCLVFKRYRLFLGIKCQWLWCAPRGNRQGRTPHGGVPQIGVHPCRLPREMWVRGCLKEILSQTDDTFYERRLAYKIYYRFR